MFNEIIILNPTGPCSLFHVQQRNFFFFFCQWWGDFGLTWWLSGKESTCSAGDTGELGSIPGSGSSPKEGNGNPLQCSCLENPRDGGAWWAAVYGVTQSRTWLSDFTFTFHFHALEKEMGTHSSVLAWRIPGTGEPGGLPSMGSHRLGHDWSNIVAAAAAAAAT